LKRNLTRILQFLTNFVHRRIKKIVVFLFKKGAQDFNSGKGRVQTLDTVLRKIQHELKNKTVIGWDHKNNTSKRKVGLVRTAREGTEKSRGPITVCNGI